MWGLQRAAFHLPDMGSRMTSDGQAEDSWGVRLAREDTGFQRLKLSFPASMEKEALEAACLNLTAAGVH